MAKSPLITIRIEAVKGGFRYDRYVGATCTDAWNCEHALTADEIEELRLTPEVSDEPEVA